MKIIGIGDHILDVIYKTSNNIPSVFAYDGGGTVWNILINLSVFFKYETYCIGTIGNDWVGEKIKKCLTDLNVNIQYCGNMKYSKIAHLLIPKDHLFIGDEDVKTSLSCPICKSSNKGSTTVFPEDFPADLRKERDIIVCFESLKSDVLLLKERATRLGWKIAVDIGYIGYLRYLDYDNIREKLSNINYLQIHKSVGKFLLNKFNVKYYSDLRKILGCTILCVTKGSNGCIFSIENDKKEYELTPTIIESIIDGTGAGDAFFSGVIHTYSSYINSNKKIDKTFIQEAFIQGNELARKVVKEIGARGHIKKLKFQNISSNSEKCPSCFNEINTTEKKIIYFQNKKIQRFCERNIFKERVTSKISFIDNLKESSYNILIIGSGGSYSAATFVSTVINNYTNSFSLCIRPAQITNKLYTKFDYIILFSYSGKNPDILNIIDKIVSESSNLKLILFTLKERNDISIPESVEIISFKNFFNDYSKEKGFLSFSGTMNPISLFQRYIFSYDNRNWNDFIISTLNYWSSFFDENQNIFTKMHEYKKIDIFYDNYSYSAAVDIESKFSESGLARILLHEKKDFSHGRFSIVANIESDLIIYLNNDHSEYDCMLISYLEESHSNKILCVNTARANHKEYSYMIMSQIFFIKISEYNKDVSLDPIYPVKALELYRYKNYTNLT